MKMHRLEVYVIDFEDFGADEFKVIIENHKHLHAFRVGAKTADIGEWHDNHELNFTAAGLEAFRKHFAE